MTEESEKTLPSVEATRISGETGAPRPRLSKRVVGAACLVVAILSVGFVYHFSSREKPLPQEVSQEAYDAARVRFRTLYRREPEQLETLSLLGELAVARGDLPLAAACFRAIPSDAPRYGIAARFQEAQVLLRLNRAIEAERCFREFLSLSDVSSRHENRALALNWIAYLLSVELRFEDRKQVLEAMHRSSRVDVYNSKQYFFPTLLIGASTRGRERLEEFLLEDPSDRRLLTALGRYLTAAGQLDDARSLLEELHSRNPLDLTSTAALLECLFEQNDWPELQRVARGLPTVKDSEPWLLTQMRGQLALHESRWSDAIELFQQLLRHDPTNPICYAGLTRAYSQLGRDEERDAAARTSKVISDIRVSLVRVTEQDWRASQDLAQACDEIGFEAAAETFRWHAARIAAATGSASPFEGKPSL